MAVMADGQAAIWTVVRQKTPPWTGAGPRKGPINGECLRIGANASHLGSADPLEPPGASGISLADNALFCLNALTMRIKAVSSILNLPSK